MMKLSKIPNIFLVAFLSLFIFFKIKCSEMDTFQKSYYGSILSGQIANYNQDNKKASLFFNFASKQNPSNKSLLNLSLMSMILDGDIELAISKIENLKKLDSFKDFNTQLIFLLKFTKHVKQKNKKAAIEILDKKKNILIDKKFFPLLTAWLSENYKSAEERINENTLNEKEDKKFYYLYRTHLALIQNYYKKNNLAINNFNVVLKSSFSENLRSLYLYFLFLKDNKLNDEEKYLEAFRTANPSHSFLFFIDKKESFFDSPNIKDYNFGISEIFYNIAEDFYNRGLVDTAIAFCQLSLFLKENNNISNYLLAQNYLGIGKNELAIETLKKVPLKSYIGWNSKLKIVDLHSINGDYNLAIESLKELKMETSDRLDLYYKFGEVFHSKKDYQSAIMNFSQAIKKLDKPTKENWYLYYSRGMSLERSNQWDEAEKDFLFALSLYPDQPLVLNYLGYSWIDFGKNLKEAQNFIKKAILLRPNDGYFVDSLGWSYYRLGNYDKAVETLEEAVSLVPNDPIINDHLGDALWRAGYENEAIFQWNRALIYKPEKDLEENLKFKLRKGL